MRRKTTGTLTLFLLAVSGGFSSFTRASAANERVEVPFVLYHNAIIVRAKVNGRGPFNMLLDTGANPSVIDLKTAKAVGLKLHGAGIQGTGGGTDANPGYVTRLPRLALGGLSARNVAAVAMDLSRVGKALGRPLAGVLGDSLLRRRIVQIDYPRRVVRFYAASPFAGTARPPNSAEFTTLPFHDRDDLVMDGVLVNGKTMPANLDTGSNSGFQITPAAVAALGLESEVGRARVGHSTGFNGTAENRTGTVQNVTVGGISVDVPSVVFFGKGTGRDSEPWGIRIGNAFLKDYVVTVDYRSMAITLEKP